MSSRICSCEYRNRYAMLQPFWRYGLGIFSPTFLFLGKRHERQVQGPFCSQPWGSYRWPAEFRLQKGNGIYRMFLALSHLRYYSDLVELDSDNIKTCVIMEQLRLVKFGTLLASWGASIEDVMTIARWFTDL